LLVTRPEMTVWIPHLVMRGLDPRIHLLREKNGLPGQVYDRAGQGWTRLPDNDDDRRAAGTTSSWL
jgi:hypothetical protein